MCDTLPKQGRGGGVGGRWRAARPFPGPSGWVRVHPVLRGWVKEIIRNFLILGAGPPTCLLNMSPNHRFSCVLGLNRTIFFSLDASILGYRGVPDRKPKETRTGNREQEGDQTDCESRDRTRQDNTGHRARADQILDPKDRGSLASLVPSPGVRSNLPHHAGVMLR